VANQTYANNTCAAASAAEPARERAVSELTIAPSATYTMCARP